MPRAKWPAYDPGKLRHKILILEQTKDANLVGQPKQVWVTRLDTHGAIDDADDTHNEFESKAHEFYQEGLTAARVSHVITIRWDRRVKVVSGMRAYFVNQRYSPPSIHTYHIAFVENVEFRDVILRLGCWEVNAQS